MSFDEATLAQIRAARPDASTWVSANAGSGKTRVLTDRVARLLLRGTDPRRILCLTFTKAAAGEMQNRLFGLLGRWAMLPDAELRAALGKLDEGDVVISDRQLSAARTLFARALETPGGLKIQTIHAFCDGLLRRFPLEAGVSPQFEVLDDRHGAQLRRELLDELAEDRAAGFAALAPHIQSHDHDLDRLLTAILRHRERFRPDADPAVLRRALGVGEVVDLTAVLKPQDLAALARALSGDGSAQAQKTLAAIQALAEDDPAAAELLEAALLTGKGEQRKALATKATLAALPEAHDMLSGLCEAVLAHAEQRKAEAALAAARALNRVAARFIAAYEARKQALGLLDYDDMIARARAVLTRGGAADWVRYKLDGGIDHVLVDEAQDTSPEQWQVIDALTAEFFAGQGARDVLRTIFVVGDQKQSIYSFQGADPAHFDTQADSYRAALEDVGRALEDCALLYSFRSAAPILALVDRLFGAQATEHKAFHADMPGRVDLWPFVTAEADKPAPVPWHIPTDAPPPTPPEVVLAGRIAAFLKDLTRGDRYLPGRKDPIGSGDVLILVQRRGRMFHPAIKALREAGVPIAGTDRLQVGAHIAVRDLLALISAVVTGADELSLAAALRSPIFGLTEREVFALAHGREGTLAEALRQGGWPEAWAIFADLRGHADFLRPYEMLSRILIRHGAASRIGAQLGREAEEAVLALLDLALDYERAEPPSLTGFLDWMQSSDPELKRQLDSTSGEVRVMTIHGAKGLEAPIVILPDTAPTRASAAPPVTPLGAGSAALTGASASRPRALARAEEDRQARQAAERERLFYVALTRAEQWLIVCGAGKDAGTPETGWHAAAEAGLLALGAETDADGVLSLTHGAWTLDPPVGPRDDGPPPPQSADPGWLRVPAPAPQPAPAPIAPSRDGVLLAGKAAAPEPAGSGEGAEAGLRRGRLMHLLLEHLPGAPPQAWPDLAASLLAGAPDATTPDEAADLLAEARAVIDAEHLRWIFDPAGLSEVPVTGRAAALGSAFPGRSLNGQIDRLLPSETEVWAIDFKSDRQPPPPGALPPAYAGQLALYAAALREIFPGRDVRAGILWTAAARLDEAPAAMLNEMVNAIDPGQGGA